MQFGWNHGVYVISSLIVLFGTVRGFFIIREEKAMADNIAAIVLFGGGFLFFTSINYIYLYTTRIKKEGSSSFPAPFLGGIFGVISMVAIVGLKPVALLPLIIDPGSIPLVVYFLYCILTELFDRGKTPDNNETKQRKEEEK